MSSKLVTNLEQKHLLLTFDAFSTLYAPRTSISRSYARIAKKHGIHNVNEKELAVSFKKAFTSASKQFPNYGKFSGLKLHEWWTYVIRDSFAPVTSTPVPDAMIRSLMREFSCKDGYSLFKDVLPFFQHPKVKNGSSPPTLEWPWMSTTVGVITNSDFRVGGILQSLGLKMPHVRNGRLVVYKNPDISFVTTSYITGVEKPNAKIFEAAQNAFHQLGSSSEISDKDITRVHVGDDVEKDAIGALGAGWTPILLDRVGKFRNEKQGHEQEDLTISVTHPVTHEEKEINVIKDLRNLVSKLSSTSP